MLTPVHAAIALDALLARSPLGYIGPGAGLGGLLVAVALVLGALFLVVGLVWYPVKRLVNGRGRDTTSGSPSAESE